MIKKLFGWGKEASEGKVDTAAEDKPVEKVPMYNIVKEDWEFWEDDGNYYPIIDYNYIARVVNGEHITLTLSHVNYMKKCCGLPTQEISNQPYDSVYIPAAWFYDKCKELYNRREGKIEK